MGLAGQRWSKWLLWLPKTLRNTVKRIMLAGFQISHSDGLKGPSHNHHIFYVYLYWLHAVKFFLTYIHAPSFTTYRDMGDVSIKNISDRPFWRDFWGPKMLKNPNFPRLKSPRTPLGELTQRASLLQGHSQLLRGQGIFALYVWKINKMLEFYTIFARNMPEFYITFSRRKIFFPEFFGRGRGQPLARGWAPGPHQLNPALRTTFNFCSFYYPAPDTSGTGYCFRSISLFRVYMYLSFFVSNITRKRLDRYAWNFQGRCGLWTDHRNDLITFWLIPRNRAMPRCATRGGVCCASAPQLVSVRNSSINQSINQSIKPLT